MPGFLFNVRIRPSNIATEYPPSAAETVYSLYSFIRQTET